MAPATLKMEDRMFNNLIESSSHARELKRRGSFVLFTTAIYVVLFIVAGVVSIYAFDARLEEPDTMIVTMLPFEPATEPPAVTHNIPPAHVGSQTTQIVRQINMSRVDDPRSVPPKTSAAPNTHLPQPLGDFIIGDHDSPLVAPTGSGHSNNGNGSGTNEAVGNPHIDVGTPPPAIVPAQRAVPRVISKGPITGLAISLPKPPYPQIAIQAHAQGAVNVQVLVDENGKVVSAKAVSGHPLLQAAAQKAAYLARFSPTRLGDQAVKVSGLITYNFTMQ
jgi:protein TonB